MRHGAVGQRAPICLGRDPMPAPVRRRYDKLLRAGHLANPLLSPQQQQQQNAAAAGTGKVLAAPPAQRGVKMASLHRQAPPMAFLCISR
jgi:hypothetical protein